MRNIGWASVVATRSTADRFSLLSRSFFFGRYDFPPCDECRTADLDTQRIEPLRDLRRRIVPPGVRFGIRCKHEVVSRDVQVPIGSPCVHGIERGTQTVRVCATDLQKMNRLRPDP